MSTHPTRRTFLRTSAGLTAAGAVADDCPKAKNDRHVIGCPPTNDQESPDEQDHETHPHHHRRPAAVPLATIRAAE